MKKNNSLFERKELKYLLSVSQKENFMKEINAYIQSDEYSQYTISNVYMDTPHYQLIRNSMDKPVYKEKMRLRSYGPVNGSNEIFIELKKKYKGIVYKRRIKMTFNEALDYLNGKLLRKGQIEREIDYFLNFYTGIAPAMFISYDREAYQGLDDSDLRITFDNNILWRDTDLSLSSELYGNEILNRDQVIMEIKCADSLPLWIVQALTKNQIYKTSFSKYGKAYSQRISCTERKVVGL